MDTKFQNDISLRFEIKNVFIAKKKKLQISTFQNGEKYSLCSSEAPEVIVNFRQNREQVYVNAYQI